MIRSKTTNDRITAVLLASLAALLVLWGRCVWLHVVGAQRYGWLASAQHRVKERLAPRRGTLYDCAGRALAVSAPASSVYAEATAVEEKGRVAQRLASVIGGEAGAIRRRLEQERRFVWIARQMSPEVVPAVMTMRADGIGIVEEPTRLYPQGRLAAQVLGFVNVDHRGLEGLELALDEPLHGRAGSRSTVRDAKGRRLVGPWTVETPPVDGLDVVLTIDSIVQQAAEDTLAWGLAQFHAKAGVILVMNPNDGAILAMANVPTYDPNEPARVPPEQRRNRAVTDVFEPGSVLKIVTASALLDAGRITPEERIFCEHGAYPTVGRHVLHDHRDYDWLSFHDVLTFSSNIGVAKAAQRLTPEELFRALSAFGFGRATGVEVPGEVSGIVKPPSQWSKLSPFIIPIGQEIAVTPMQLAVMISAVANGGLRVQPHLIERFQWSPTGSAHGTGTFSTMGATSCPPIRCSTTWPPTANGRDAMAGRSPTGSAHGTGTFSPMGATSCPPICCSTTWPPTANGRDAMAGSPEGRLRRAASPAPAPVRIITAETASLLQSLLSDVVASGTGQSARIEGLTVAGKTGTAQKLEPDGRRYSHSRFVASFVGFGPVPDPRFAIVVCMDEPHPLYYGGVVSAPMFKRLVERLSSYWKLPRLQLARAERPQGHGD